MTDANRPKDGATRLARYREKQAKLGRKGRLLYLTDEEKAAVDKLLALWRCYGIDSRS